MAMTQMHLVLVWVACVAKASPTIEFGRSLDSGTTCEASDCLSTQRRGKGELFFQTQRHMLTDKVHSHTCVEPAFCTEPHDSVWMPLCNHWNEVVAIGAIPNASNVCCSSLPDICQHEGKTCQTSDDCLKPSCAQEEWYLKHIEPGSTDAFALFLQDLTCFRQCGFKMAPSECTSSDADFGMKQANDETLKVFVTLNRNDIDATAFSVVRQLSTVAVIPIDEEEAGLTQEHSSVSMDDIERRAAAIASLMKERHLMSRRKNNAKKVDQGADLDSSLNSVASQKGMY